jgi:dTDP-4-dehydrorhamnose 3,5-epimerase
MCGDNIMMQDSFIHDIKKQYDDIVIRQNLPLLITLPINIDDRGYLRKLWTSSMGYGANEMYVTTTEPGIVKGWHLHEFQTDAISCIKGKIKLVCCDTKINNIHKFFLMEHVPTTVIIPPHYWHGWECLSAEEAMVVNCCSSEYNSDTPDETRIDPYSMPKVEKWTVVSR